MKSILPNLFSINLIAYSYLSNLLLHFLTSPNLPLPNISPYSKLNSLSNYSFVLKSSHLSLIYSNLYLELGSYFKILVITLNNVSLVSYIYFK